jgi:hypothetical protein
MQWIMRIGLTVLVVAGLVVVELLKAPRDWLSDHLNQVSLMITTLALLVAAYAAEQARRTVVQATRFRDIDRLEQIRDRVEKLIPAVNSVELSAELSRFDEKYLPCCWALDATLPVPEGSRLDKSLVLAAENELTVKLKSLRKKESG